MSNKNKLTIVMYHYVRPIKDSHYPGIKGLELEGFKRQLDYLSSKYSMITAEQLIKNSLGKEDLPKNSCYLTFDDGFKDHIEYVMPELLSRKLQGSFFPPANAIEKREMLNVHAIHFILASTNDYKKLVIDINKACFELGFTMSELNSLKDIWGVPSKYDVAEIVYVKRMLQHVLPEHDRSKIISELFKKYMMKNMNEFADELYMSISDTKNLINNGMYVGSHGGSHRWLDKESKSYQESDIKLSLKFLKKVGAPIYNWIMCYPYGGYNEDTLNILKLNNCSIGLTTKSGEALLDRSKMLELKRFNTNDFPQ
tara:strand:+ start:1203 stop:2138 length:936 start_codon:yes stop_codon:yes gene_type:complete